MASGWEPEIVGGIKRYLNEILPRLRSRGHEILVISSSLHRSNMSENLGIPVRYIRYHGGLSTTLTVPMKIVWSLYYLARFKPTVVFAQKAANAIYAPIFRLFGVPTVCHSHGVFSFAEPHMTEAMAYYKSQSPVRWLIAKLGPIIERLSMRLCSSIIVFTIFHARHLSEKNGIPLKKLKIIPNGVDMTRYNPSQDGSKFRERYNLKGRVVGYCGRIIFLKGIDTLIKAMSLVTKKYHDSKLCLVGDFPEHPQAKWVEMVREIDLEDKVVFTGPITDEWMPYAYGAFDVYCQLTAPTYGFEIAMCEAMASGKPVVSTEATERNEIFGDAYYSCKWKDLKSTAEAIDALLESPQLRKALGEKARAKMMKYDWTIIVDEVEETLSTAK
jgi:glycosyltransferase involved in cell wall biosynthesis